MEPKSSLPHSEVPTTCLCPEQVWSSQYPYIPLPEINLNIILPSMPGSPKWSLSHMFPTKTVYMLLLYPICATCPAYLHSSRFDHLNNIGEEYWHWAPPYIVFSTPLLPRPSSAQIFSTTPYFKHPHPTFLPHCQRPSFTPIQNSRQNECCIS